MIEVFLFIIGLVFLAWLYELVQQALKGTDAENLAPPRPVVPLNLMDSDEAVIVSEGRGRIAFANQSARDWFGMNGGVPNLNLMSQHVQPPDALHDLLAGAGHSSFRLGQRQVEAVSHAIPGAEGQRMVIVMREMTASAFQAYTDFDPLRALAILSDISQGVGAGLDMEAMLRLIFRSMEQAIKFDSAETTLWQPQTRTLRSAGRIVVRTVTGALAPSTEFPESVYEVGEGYTGWIAMYRQPLLIHNVATRTDVIPKTYQSDFQSYLGLPLTIGDQFIGTVELTHRDRNAFTQRDLALLQAVSGQIAAAIQSARLNREQSARVAELGGLQQIAEAMGQLGEPAEVYGRLTQRLATLISVELCGVLIYDENEQQFRSQPPFYGVPDALIRHYRLAVLPGTELYTIWHHLPWWFTNEAESPLIQAMGFDDVMQAMRINALALVPMTIGTRRIGLLLVANKRSGDRFTEEDMRTLMTFASQAAVVTENARLYQEEQRRSREFGGLQQIAQAIGVLRNPSELYSQITERIAGLLNAQMCGILLYDSKDRSLVSQQPFFGMDDPETVRFYQLPSPPNGPLARLWQARDTWFANDLRRDPDVPEDLATLAVQVGIHQIIMATLTVGGNRLGIIQAANRADNSDFTADDARLLSIFAGQAAILVDNARLYREMQHRTHEAEGLRAVTEIAAQAVPTLDTVEAVLAAVANVLEVQIVTIALVEESSGQLVIDPAYVLGAKLVDPYRIDAYAPGFEESVMISRQPLISQDLRSDARVLPPYRDLIQQLNLTNAVQVPLVIQDRSIGELTAANRTTDEPYADTDLQLLTSLSSQIAAMLDRMHLYASTDQDLRARVQELDALGRVSHELSQTIELDRILDVIRQEALRSTNANAATIVLLTDRDDWHSPEQPEVERRFGEGRTLRDLAPVERASILRNDVIRIDDYQGTDFIPRPAKTRSSLVVPIVFGELVIGTLHLYSTTAQAFDQRVVDFAVSLTDQATVAIGNYRRYQEQLTSNRALRVRAERMGRIFEMGELFRQGASLDELLEEVAHSIQETVNFNVVLISLVDERAAALRRTAQAGLPLAVFQQLQATLPPLDQARSLMQDQYRVSNSYFLPAERAEALREGLPVYQILQERMGTSPRAWDPEDLMLVPVYGANRRLLGLISVDEPQSGRRPDLNTVEALEVFANQAAFFIENYRLLERIQQEAEATRRERDRLAQLHLVASEIQRAPDVPSRLQVVANGIHDAGWGHVVITLRDENLEATALIQAGFTPEEAIRLSDEVQIGEIWRTWINDLGFYELKLGAGYYMRYNQPWVVKNVLKGREVQPAVAADDEWHPQDVLYLLLVGQDQKRIIGIIAMTDPADGQVPTEASLQPFELFASQAAAAIETTRLYQETVRAAEQEQRLNEVMEAVSASISPEAVIQVVGRGLQQMVPFTRMSVALYSAATNQFDILGTEIALDTSVTVVKDQPIPLDKTATGQAFIDTKPHLFQMPDPAVEKYTDLHEWYESGERSTLLVPMTSAGQIVGVLRLGSELANAFGFQENLDLIQRLANLSAVSLENARLFEQAQQRAAELDDQARRLTLINRIASLLAQSLDSQEIYRIALNELQAVLGAQYGGVAIFENEASAVLALDTHPAVSTPGAIHLSLANNQAMDLVRSTHHPVYAEDALSDPRFEATRDLLRARGTRSLIIIPLAVSGRVIGTIGLDFVDRHLFTDVEIELSETIASQVAVALDKASLLSETERRAIALNEQTRRLTSLNRMSARLAQTLDPQEIYRIVLQEIQEAIGCQYSGLMLLDADGATSRLVLSTHPMDVPLPDLAIPVKGNPVAEYMMATSQPVIAEDVLHDPRFEALWAVEEARDTRAMMIVPVIMNERLIGTIGLDSSHARQFTPEEIELALTASNQAAVAIENARLFTEAQRHAIEMDAQAQRLALINRVSGRLAQSLDPQEIYGIVLSELADILRVQMAGLVLFESETLGRLVLSYPFTQATPNLTISLEGNRSIEIVRETHRPLISTDVLNDPVFEQAWEVLKLRGTRSLMIVPLIVGDQVVGTIGLDSTELRKFTDAEIEVTETIASQASLAVEKARLYNETLGLTIFNQAVVESIQQGIVVLDRDLIIRRVNHFMTVRYGWSDAAVDRGLFDYRPDYGQFLRAPMAVALGMGEPQVQYEVERRDEAGNPSIRNYYVYPMLENRQVTGLVLLIEDVSERARLESDLETRAVQMAALSEVSSQITSTLEPDQVINVILDALDRVIPYDGVSLWLRTAGREELSIVAARGYRDADATGVDELLGLKVEIPYSPLFREMSENARVINVGDVGAGDPRFPYGSAAVYKNWLGAPLISKGTVVGVMALEKRETQFYTPLHEQLALTFANQAAVAFDNAQLFQETRERAQTLDDQAKRLALLNRVSLALAQTLDLENIYEIALRETAIALDIEEGAAIQVDPENPLGIVIVEYPRGDAPPQQVYDLVQNEAMDRVRNALIPVVIDNTGTDSLTQDLRKMLRRADVQRSLFVPLVVGGDVIGVLRLDTTIQERQFTIEQIELAQTIASQAGVAVQNATLFEQAAIRRSELETLFESAQATAVTLDLDEVVRRVTMQMLTALITDACAIFLWDDVNNRLEVRGEISSRTAEEGADQRGKMISLQEYPLREKALRERELIIVRSDDEDLPPGEQQLMVQHNAASRLLIPLVVNEISIGLVEVETLDPERYFRADTLRLARTLASQAAISIENARLQTETRRTVEELYIINDMSGELSSAKSQQQLLDVVDMQLPNLIDAQYIYVALYDASAKMLSFPLATSILDDQPLNLPDTLFGQDEFSLIIKRQAPLLLVGENLDQVRHSLGIETMLPEARSFVGVPLFAGDEVIGVLAARDDKASFTFSYNDQRILNTVSAQLGVAIQSTRLFQQTLQLAEELDRRVRERTAELEQERQHISTLYSITTELATSLDMERLLSRSLQMVAESVGSTEGAILAVDPISDRLYFRARFGTMVASTPEGEENLSIGANEGLAGWAIQNRQSLIVDNVDDDPRWLMTSEADKRSHSAIVSLIESNEDVLGVILLYGESVRAFNNDHLRLVTAAANQIANAMNNAELYSLIRDQAERLGSMLRQEQVEATKSGAILDSVADGVMVTDSEGKVILFNSAAARILRLPVKNVLGRLSTDIAGLYGAGRTRWAETISEWMVDPTVHQPGEFLEERITLEDERVISVRVSPVNMGDQFLGTVSIFRDITREVEVDRLKSEFVATVSHELRTPMTSIKGYADLLLLGAAGDISEQQHRFLETIKQNADRLSILVNDLLDISRIDQGRMELRFSPVEVADVLNAAAVHVRARSDDEHRPMNVIIRLPEDQHLTVWGDYDKVTQIVSNLVDNAFNYTPTNGTITLAAVPADDPDQVVLSVTDTGIGIQPDIADRIFERFFRGDEVHEMVMDTPGTGLGLAIVRELVQVHSGKIWFESEVGQGTTFYVELPTKALQPASN